MEWIPVRYLPLHHYPPPPLLSKIDVTGMLASTFSTQIADIMSRVERLDAAVYWLLHAKQIRNRVLHSTTRRADLKLGRVFVDLSGKESVTSMKGTGMQCVVIIKDDFRDTRCSTSFTTSLTPLPLPDILSLVCVHMLSLPRCRLLGINFWGKISGVVLGRCALTTR